VFLGVSTLNLDAKGRIAIPAKHRETLAQTCASRVVVTINPNRDDRCLWLYPESEWREIARNLSRLPPMIRQNQLIQRLMLGHASEVELDGQGRVLLPNELREYAGLGKRVSLVGQMHKFEIWDEEIWSGSREQWLGEALTEESGMSEELKGMRL
jgi:MraZ protein